MSLVYPQLDGVKINEDRTLPVAVIQAIRKAYDYAGMAIATATGVAIRVLQDTHANRMLHPAILYPEGSFYIETDRNNVVYVSRPIGGALTWIYLGGQLFAVLASRPTDLGVNDAGFLFESTDTLQTYQWSGIAWLEITPANVVQIAYATGSLTLAAGHADVPGGGPAGVCGFALTRAGHYLITASFYFVGLGAGDINQNLVGYLSADGTEQTAVATLTAATANCGSTNSQQWTYLPATAGKIVKLRGAKTGGTGASIISTAHTSISALWVGP